RYVLICYDYHSWSLLFFFGHATPPAEIYTLSLHDALPISLRRLRTDWIDLYQMHHVDRRAPWEEIWQAMELLVSSGKVRYVGSRSEEHTSELQSRFDLVCRLLLEKKKILICTIRQRISDPP